VGPRTNLNNVVIRVPYIVASHLKILIPVGTAMIIERKKSLFLAGNETVDHPAHSQVTTSSTPYWIQFLPFNF
jgi:hypothetical protein